MPGFLRRNRKEWMDLDGWGGVEEPGGIVGRETNQNTLYGKKKSVFFKS